MSQEDRKATLKELLTRFREGNEFDEEAIERYAEAGAEALAMQEDAARWLTVDETAERLHLTPEKVRELAGKRELPAAQNKESELRFHRRDVSLYRLRHSVGATEHSIQQIAPPMAWEEAEQWGLDPYQELTPG